MEKYIDLGIDFGAENIVIIAIGYDNKGRSDYKLINLESSGSIKNYIGKKKDNSYEIGNNAKVAYMYKNQNNDYDWVSGRYKSYIYENSSPDFAIRPDELLKIGITEIINKLENFDFSPLLSGSIRNIAIGIPQEWDISKRQLYKEVLSIWKHGNVSLLTEPVAATISAYKRGIADLLNNVIMILDIGASTFDISFSQYTENKSLNIYKTNYRSDFAGHYFDIIFTAFTLINENNKLALNDVIDRISKIKLRNIDDYINYLFKYQDRYSTLLLEIENVKENYLNEIIKFNKKKLIDVGNKHLIVNKQIYQDALSYYSSKIVKDIKNVIQNFKSSEKYLGNIFLFLCGGASSLSGLEKSLKDKLNIEEGQRLFSIIKEGSGNKIDTTIATGLSYYAQDNSLINKKLNCSIYTKFFVDDTKEEFCLFTHNSDYPLKEFKKFSDFINDSHSFEYHGNDSGTIEIPIIIKCFNSLEPIEKIITASLMNSSVGDLFDIHFNIDLEDFLTIKFINLSQQKEFITRVSL